MFRKPETRFDPTGRGLGELPRSYRQNRSSAPPADAAPPAKPAPEFSIFEARSIVRDLFEPKPWIYWCDFLGSLIVGGICWGISRRLPFRLSPEAGVPLFLALFGVACILYYRATLFTHELTHLKRDSFRNFRIAWNVLCGIPFLMPSFLYHTHVDHHARRQYGTDSDGEYLPFANWPRWRMFWYMAQPFTVPAIAVVRFMVLAPLSWIAPPFRRWLLRHASSMVIDPYYVRPLPTHAELRIWRLQEVCCWLLTTSVAVLVTAGIVPLGFVIQAYATSVVILFFNALRTLGSHRYRSQGETMTFTEQLLDSVNYPRHRFLSSLWAPVGLRFHALHHLFPSMPYHSLETAHRRLMAQLPADSPYRQTESPSLRAALKQLWEDAGAHGSVPATAPPQREMAASETAG